MIFTRPSKGICTKSRNKKINRPHSRVFRGGF